MVWNRPIGSGGFGHVLVTVRKTLVVFYFVSAAIKSASKSTFRA